MTDTGIKIIEIGARMGGTCIPELCTLYTGINFYEIVIKLAIGELFSESFPRLSGAWSANLLRSKKTGNAGKMDANIKQNKQHFVEIKLDYPLGGFIPKFNTGNQRIGHVITKSNNLEHAENISQKFEEDFQKSMEWF